MSWEQIPGWSGFLPIYDRAVAEAPSDKESTIVEIGVAFGRSVAYLARKVIDSGKPIHVYAVDPWRDDWWMPPNNYPADAPRPTWGGEYAEWARELGGPFRAFIHAMTAHAPEELERIKVLRLYSAEAAAIFRHRFRSNVGCVLIDGNHNYAQVFDDIRQWRDIVRPGGILAGDDYHTVDFPGVVRAVKELLPDANVEGNTWWVRV